VQRVHDLRPIQRYRGEVIARLDLYELEFH